MHLMSDLKNVLVVLCVLILYQGLSDQSLSKLWKHKRFHEPQNRTQVLKNKQKIFQNRLFVNSEMEIGESEKRSLTITRIQKDGTTMDTVKIDDPKRSEKNNGGEDSQRDISHQQGSISHVNTGLSRVLPKLEKSPQLNIPSAQANRESTKVLNRLPLVAKPGGPVLPIPWPAWLTCPTASLSLIRPSTTRIALSVTPSCCSCPGICIDMNLCAKQLPICSALPKCATGQCAQNCCGR